MKAREFRKLKEIERVKAQRRKACGQGGVLLKENVPEAKKGQTRDICAAAVGIGSGHNGERAAKGESIPSLQLRLLG